MTITVNLETVIRAAWCHCDGPIITTKTVGKADHCHFCGRIVRDRESGMECTMVYETFPTAGIQ